MATRTAPRRIKNRGLLTADDRAFFRGAKDVEDPEKVAREKRFNVRQRIERIGADLRILQEAGESDVVEDFYREAGRYERLEREVERLRKEVDGE